MIPGIVLVAAAPLALGQLALGQATPVEIRDDVKTILADKDYAFCHDEGLAMFTMEREYCELVGDRNDVCPALPKVCKNDFQGDYTFVPKGRLRFGRDGVDYGPRDTANGGDGDGKGSGSGDGNGSGDGKGSGSGSGSGDGKGSGSGSGSGDGKGSGSGHDGDGKGSGHDARDKSQKSSPPPKEHDERKAKKPEPPKDPPEPPKPIEIPGWLALLGRVLFYVLAAGVIAAIVYVIAKSLLKDKEPESEEEKDTKKVPDEEEPEERPRGPIEKDVDRLLARARAAAAAGDYKKAIEDAYAALLRRLEGDGLIDLHPSRTNGDYVRSIRENVQLRGAVRGIAADVERVQFGSEAPSPTVFDSIYQRVLPLVGRVAVLALVLLAFAPLASCDATSPRGRDGSVLALPFEGEKTKGGSYPMGLRGVVDLLRKENLTVTFDRPEDGVPTGERKAIVILPGTRLDKDGWKHLKSWVRKEGGIVVFAGMREEVEDAFPIRGLASKGRGPVRPDMTYQSWGPGHELALPYARALDLGPDKLKASFAGIQPLLARNDETYAAVIDGRELTGNGKVVVFADDRLFANIALTLGDNASFLRRMFKNGLAVSSVEIWDDARGGGGAGGGGDGEEGQRGSSSPIESIVKAHLLPIVLQLLALVVLYLLFRGTRFGSPRDPKEESRRSFADHGRALGLTYARARASRHAAGVYAVWALDRLRERLLGSGRRGGLSQLAEAIAARTGQPFGAVMQVLTEAYGLRDEVAPPSSYRAPGAYGAPPGRGQSKRADAAEQARHFWIMEQLDGYLAATKGAQKTPRGRT